MNRPVFLLLATTAATALGSAARAADPAAAGDLVARGKYLVYAGDCDACHTAPGGQKLAGNVEFKTPFGIMYSANITSDKQYGIGNWTADDLYQLFHEGHGKEHHWVYPGFPYPWFTIVTKQDVTAIHAYLETVEPVAVKKKDNKLIPPLGFRPSMIGWNMLFFKPHDFVPIAGASDEVNRGAYLSEGLAHCSDCHTPKNVLQAPKNDHPYAGGVVDHWYAPNITQSKDEGIGDWTPDELTGYLKTGVSKTHGVALGPMAQAVHDSFSHMTDADLKAISAYIFTLTPQKSYEQRVPLLVSDARPGAAVYVTFCASCHQQNGQGVAGKIPALDGNGVVTAKGPESIIRVILGGVRAQGNYGPMPGYGIAMDDQQVADVTNYVRSAWSNKAPANASPGAVSAVAKDTRSILAGTQPCPPVGDSALEHAVADDASGIPAILQAAVNDEVLTQSTTKLAALIHAKVPDAKQAEIVNYTTDGYCKALANDASMEAVQRWEHLTRFSVAMYQALTAHGRQ